MLPKCGKVKICQNNSNTKIHSQILRADLVRGSLFTSYFTFSNKRRLRRNISLKYAKLFDKGTKTFIGIRKWHRFKEICEILTAVSRYDAVKFGRQVSNHLLTLASTQEMSSYSTINKAAGSSKYPCLSTKLNEALFGKNVILKKKNVWERGVQNDICICETWG
jgi:hypothetical protein